MSYLNISVFYSFGRSGSTLLNQCLGCHSNNAVLSEVNPACSYRSVAWQAYHWLGLISENDLPGFSRLTYAQQVTELARLCLQQQRHLIVRDWSTVNFLANVSSGIEPSYVLEQEFYLKNIEQLNCRQMVFTRRSSGAFHSLRTRFPQYHSLPVEEFARSYLNYAQSVCRFPIFHLEDFTARPAHWLTNICECLDVAYAKDFQEKFADYKDCSGNITIGKDTFSKTSRMITPVTSSESVAPHPLLTEADALLGYETN